MKHTIVVEIPDHADPQHAEERITSAIQRIAWTNPTYQRDGRTRNDFAKVAEYHREEIILTPTQADIFLSAADPDAQGDDRALSWCPSGRGSAQPASDTGMGADGSYDYYEILFSLEDGHGDEEALDVFAAVEKAPGVTGAAFSAGNYSDSHPFSKAAVQRAVDALKREDAAAPYRTDLAYRLMVGIVLSAACNPSQPSQRANAAAAGGGPIPDQPDTGATP